MPLMNYIMIGSMILIMAGLMILIMRVLHSIRSVHGRHTQASTSQTQRVLPMIHWIIRVLLRAGIRISILGPMMLLTVRGRKTGEPRTIAVDIHEHEGRRFLIATHGEGNWVRNLRAAGEGSLGIGRRHQAFTAMELTPEAGGPVIKNVLGPILASRGVRGSTLRDHLGVRADSSLEDFINVARSHPVFELSSPASHSHTHQQPASTKEEHHQHAHHNEMHHEHDHSHDHAHAPGRLGELIAALPFLHGHLHGEAHVDRALETSERGVWALKVSLLGLGATALFQVVIVLLSGSVGLLADGIHNVTDALTAIPLWIAFALARRPATRRYTYGYGRAEDIAGVIIVLMILLSSLLAAYESYQKLLHPEPLRYVWWVMAAAIVGFLGNEGVANLRIRIGRQIGSAALVADGQHARVDGWTSLAVLLGAVGSLLGFPLADPIIGILITIIILFIVKDSAVTMWHRLMDAVDPQQVAAVEHIARASAGVYAVHEVRLRWIGHTLHTELHITVNEDLSTWESHQIAEQVRHALFDAQPKLATVMIHVDPCGHSGKDSHAPHSHFSHPLPAVTLASSGQ
jgi:deazaflavin-dependent oxidoreductase (nitroreductase family)